MTNKKREVKKSKLEELTVKAIVQVLADYNFNHVPNLYNQSGELEGLAVPTDKQILVSDRPLINERYNAIIHELFHAYDILRGMKSNENYTLRRADAQAKKLFGGLK